MAQLRIEFNSKGFRALLQSRDLEEGLGGPLNAAISALPTGDGEVWNVATFQGRDRVQGIVSTSNHASRVAAADGALIRALDAMRGARIS